MSRPERKIVLPSDFEVRAILAAMTSELIPEDLAAARKRTRSVAVSISIAAFSFAANGMLFLLRFRKDHDPLHIVFAALCVLVAGALLYKSATFFSFLAREAKLKISEQLEHLNASM
jgi:hypothetical protein